MFQRTALISIFATLNVMAAATALDPGANARVERHIIVQGRVLGPDGKGMGGWPVALIGTQRYLEFSHRATGGDIATVARSVTDAAGYFTIDVPRERKYQFWFLRYADPAHLDAVKHLAPPDQEITTLMRGGRVAVVEAAVQFHPQWLELERLVSESGGAASEKGKILLALGLPEKRATGAAAEPDVDEEWWYFTKGVVYSFRGSEPITLRRFEPVKPPAGTASGAAGAPPREG